MKLTITIYSKTDDFSSTLEHVKKQIDAGFRSGSDMNDDEEFYYDTEKEA